MSAGFAVRQLSFNPCCGSWRILEEDAFPRCISGHHHCTVARTEKEDPESGKMLYFEIIFCNDYVGIVSVTWESIAPAAGMSGLFCT